MNVLFFFYFSIEGKELAGKSDQVHDPKRNVNGIEFGSILRRFFINTLFDSTFMQIGIIVGSAFAANQDLHLIMRTLVASSIALGISTGVSTYESEKLERMIKIAELEKAMFRKLDKTVISDRDRTSVFMISIIYSINRTNDFRQFNDG